jgi:hypothetical protein
LCFEEIFTVDPTLAFIGNFSIGEIIL